MYKDVHCKTVMEKLGNNLHRGRVWVNRHMFIKEQCLCKATKLQTSAISGEVKVGGRHIFLYMPSCTLLEFFLIRIYYLFMKLSRNLCRPHPSLKGCDSASVEPGH